LIYGDGELGRVGPPMDQASRCELCHIGHVIVIEMTAPRIANMAPTRSRNVDRFSCGISAANVINV
jgi:hypothetical protein